MLILVPKETHPLETRVALVPAAAAKLVKLGAQVVHRVRRRNGRRSS